ncbi:hypothetical protein K469DRAFT_478668, partial [Zopfia rhizophila CBS 207.26]
KPLAELTVPKADQVKVESSLQNEVLQTPVTAEVLTSLRSLIEQNAHAFDETSKQHLQKLANAAQRSSKRRQSAKSSVVWKAKVMSYEDIEEARGKRAAKKA